MRHRTLALVLVLAACRQRPAAREPEPSPSPPPGPPIPVLPAGFRVVGEPVVTEAFLPPEAALRALVSDLTLLRADARARNGDLLVTFEARAMHVTARDGRRRTSRLPDGLTLPGGPTHVLLGADLRVEIWGENGPQLVGDEEVTVVAARIDAGGGNVQEFRLVAKAGSGFRSISTGRQAG